MAAARRELSNHVRRRWQPADPSTVPEIGKPISGYAQDDIPELGQVKISFPERAGRVGDLRNPHKESLAANFYPFQVHGERECSVVAKSQRAARILAHVFSMCSRDAHWPSFV